MDEYDCSADFWSVLGSQSCELIWRPFERSQHHWWVLAYKIHVYEDLKGGLHFLLLRMYF